MSRIVNCVVLKREAEGLDTTMIINENGLNTADPGSVEVIEQHMIGFLFNEGDQGNVPQGFSPPGAKK
jgi:Fe-S cluster biosynthesis and repair protein YggX